MYVKDNMTRNPYTVGPDHSVSEALDIMSASKISRLPVVDKKGVLIGLVTRSLIASNTPNNSSSLSVFELNYLLNKLQIKDIMIKIDDVVSIDPDALLEDAASIMLDKDISCLPVVEKDNLLVGIITHNDIFSAFIDLLGYHKNGIRYVINVPEDIPGVMAGIADVFTLEEISISNLAVYHTDRGIEVIVISYGDKNIIDKLKAKGYNVTSCITLKEHE